MPVCEWTEGLSIFDDYTNFIGIIHDGYVFNENNERTHSVSPDGDIYELDSKRYIGTIEDDGDIHCNGQVVGYWVE